ncbi:hypothetical protein PAXINDRAFT_102261 [Paxillus involutus ATCC 200175]|uniref:Uncharacterized protein n=1 Tax=Paxillus involutus ATCC 200175 TaxID=664439 RepID=A0A0C9TNG2_PAXIN|nr:hypothetical protein PAXINDRAFT_102261 [Paxillus involutus ATCC 200175]
MATSLQRIMTSDGRFLTLLTKEGPVTAEADNLAFNQIWDIPTLSSPYSTIQNLGYATPKPYAGLDADGITIVGGQVPLAWNIISSGGNTFIQKVGSNLAWTIESGIGSTVELAAQSLTDPTQQLTLVAAPA